MARGTVVSAFGAGFILLAIVALFAFQVGKRHSPGRRIQSSHIIRESEIDLGRADPHVSLVSSSAKHLMQLIIGSSWLGHDRA